MTDVTILRCKKDIAGFEVHGHSGYADEGSDIVCSAVSALTQTAVIGLQELLKLTPALEIENGDMVCILPADMEEETNRQANLILETMALGIRSIEKTYGDYIKISERTV